MLPNFSAKITSTFAKATFMWSLFSENGNPITSLSRRLASQFRSRRNPNLISTSVRLGSCGQDSSSFNRKPTSSSRLRAISKNTNSARLWLMPSNGHKHLCLFFRIGEQSEEGVSLMIIVCLLWNSLSRLSLLRMCCFKIVFFSCLPGFAALWMIVYLGLLDILRVECSNNAKGVVQIVYFAHRILEPADLNQILHPRRSHLFKQSQKGLLCHVQGQLPKYQGHLAC